MSPRAQTEGQAATESLLWILIFAAFASGTLRFYASELRVLNCERALFGATHAALLGEVKSSLHLRLSRIGADGWRGELACESGIRTLELPPLGSAQFGASADR